MKVRRILKYISTIILALPVLTMTTGCSSGSGFSPNTLCLQFNDFLQKSQEDGSQEQMIQEWFSVNSESKRVDYESLKDINGTLNIGLIDGLEPFSFVGDNKFTGLIIDMMTRFAKEYGYGVSFHNFNGATALISSVVSGNCDIGASSITITKERAKTVAFSNPFMVDSAAFLIKKENASIYTRKEDLKGKTVAIESGAMYGAMLQKLVPDVNIIELSSVAELCKAVEDGIADACLSDASALKFAVLHRERLTFFNDDMLENNLGIFFRKTTFTEFDELNGKTIGIFEADGTEKYLNDLIEQPTFKKYQYGDDNLIMKDLENDVIQAACIYTDVARYSYKDQFSNYAIIGKPVFSIESYLNFPLTKDGKMFLNHFDNFIDQNYSNFLFNNIKRSWINNHSFEHDKLVDYRTLPAINGTLKVGLDGINEPYSMKIDDKYQGIIVDYLTIFANVNGFALDFYNCLPREVDEKFNNETINAYVSFNMFEGIGDNYNKSKAFGYCDLNLLVRDTYDSKQNFFQVMATNFKKTFIVEDRYKTFLSGIGTTLIITICSILLGLIMGFGVFMLLRNTNKITDVIYRILELFISGTPAVVFLMIFYYIFFAGGKAPAIVVSIIAFAFIFMCSTVTMLRTGFDSIDKGQNEAAFTLGYSKFRTFFKILLPQASKTFMPLLKGNVIEHIKATAIVGYIAIIDLTKATEIVRSRTFDAFFSLIVTTILYFLIEYAFILLLKLIPVDPKKRKNIRVLKGVDDHD